MTFTQVSEEKESDIKFSWVIFNQEKHPLIFDGAGGVLGRAGNGYVELDIAERCAYGLGDEEKLSDLFDPATWYDDNQQYHYIIQYYILVVYSC